MLPIRKPSPKDCRNCGLRPDSLAHGFMCPGYEPKRKPIKPGEPVLFMATVVAESLGGVLVLVDGCPVFIPGKAIVEMDFKIVGRKK